ncbi:phosphatidylinositol N-acetylglucosaminyltransferase-domain-containing protein [Jimgerdemannia flammicorona]|uniref:Phosphatidylinositol N-acetylglucosaminyltransferase-domain-containing protein n=1 Tax=Jimgerdemannia flammicorona TaxID=994334 RepID=A0A433B902_9FUNG|nr:phosphatidylinositol N-acetylglucosaminyltransferase-domain-containing protein [Jimgerdemannia flammicorona]
MVKWWLARCDCTLFLYYLPTFMAYAYCPNDGRKFLDDEAACPECGLERDKHWVGLNAKGGFRNLDHHVDPPTIAPTPGTTRVPDQTSLAKTDVRQAGLSGQLLNVRSYDYWTVVYESGVISQHISTIVVFIAVFIYLYNDMLSARSLIWIGSVLTAAGYIFWDWSIVQTEPSYRNKRKKTAKGALLFFLTLLGLSPILKTLTKDTSDDTIWALTVCLFMANMLFHDYGSNNRTNIKFPGSVSTNAAIFASVLLASRLGRLGTNSHVFGLMSFAVEWFALFPIFRRYLKVGVEVGKIGLGETFSKDSPPYPDHSTEPDIQRQCDLNDPALPDGHSTFFTHLQGRHDSVHTGLGVHHVLLSVLADLDPEIQKRDSRAMGRGPPKVAAHAKSCGRVSETRVCPFAQARSTTYGIRQNRGLRSCRSAEWKSGSTLRYGFR